MSDQPAVGALTGHEWKRLNKESLNRAYWRARRAGATSWGIVSAFRFGLSRDENNRRHNEMRLRVRQMGYGFLRLRCHWQADSASPVESEHVLLVPGLSEKHAKELMHDFDQDAVIYSGTEHDGNVAVYHKDERVDDLGRFHPGRLLSAYSSLKRTPLACKGFEALPNTWIQAMIESRKPQVCVAPGVFISVP